MGNTCTKTSEAVDSRVGDKYQSPPSKREDDLVRRRKGVPAKKDAPRVAGAEGDREGVISVVKHIEALEHTLRPTFSPINAALRHAEFRQFTPIFARGKAALAVASCAAIQRPRHILVGGEDRSIALLNYETGHVMRRWVHAHQNDINCITTPKSSEIFATASRDKTVKVWDFTSDNPLNELRGHTLNVSSIDMNGDNSLLVSGSKDNTVRLWDVEKGEELFCADIKLNVVHFVRFTPSLNCVAQGGEDLAVRLWDVRTKGTYRDLHLSKTIEGMDYYPVCCEVVPGDPNVLLTGHNGVNGCGSYVAQWDLRMGDRTALYKGHHATVSGLRMVASSVYGEGSFFTSSEDGTFGVWNTEDGEASGEVQLSEGHQFCFPEGRVTSFEAEDNGDTVVALDDGCLVVLRPVMKEDAVVPSLRLRYVGAITGQKHN